MATTRSAEFLVPSRMAFQVWGDVDGGNDPVIPPTLYLLYMVYHHRSEAVLHLISPFRAKASHSS